jgi:HK97 family phage major capsid protein
LSVSPQAARPDQLRLRDVLNVGRTNSNKVEWVREASYTSAAEPVAETAAKPEGTAEYDIASADVRTIAAWMPATVQQLADFPMLRTLLDGRLRHDVLLEEEEQIMYGSGSGQDFTGLTVVSGTNDIATADNRLTSPTLADQIRVGITEVQRVGRRDPNAVLMHPLDFEELSLLKGSDEHYLAHIDATSSGALRIWGLPVVVSMAQEFREDPSATNRRTLIVGDFQNGCGLFVREDVSVMVGMINDQFTKNIRTVLAEGRSAFAIFEPKAFSILQTQASA